MLRDRIGALLLVLFVSGCASSEVEVTDAPLDDPALLEAILEDVRVGWEQGDGTPFYSHFLDWDGARYFEGGGQNLGLQDLVENHVEPEAELGLSLGFSDIQTHFEGTFAWAVELISPTSSRKSVPPCACSKDPICCLCAPVNDPFSCPNNSLSISSPGIAAQFTATNGPALRSES